MDRLGQTAAAMVDVTETPALTNGSGGLWQLWQRLPGPAGVRAWEVYVTGTGATRGVPAAGGR
jgi:hypothetical protein